MLPLIAIVATTLSGPTQHPDMSGADSPTGNFSGQGTMPSPDAGLRKGAVPGAGKPQVHVFQADTPFESEGFGTAPRAMRQYVLGTQQSDAMATVDQAEVPESHDGQRTRMSTGAVSGDGQIHEEAMGQASPSLSHESSATQQWTGQKPTMEGVTHQHHGGVTHEDDSAEDGDVTDDELAMIRAQVERARRARDEMRRIEKERLLLALARYENEINAIANDLDEAGLGNDDVQAFQREQHQSTPTQPPLPQQAPVTQPHYQVATAGPDGGDDPSDKGSDEGSDGSGDNHRPPTQQGGDSGADSSGTDSAEGGGWTTVLKGKVTQKWKASDVPRYGGDINHFKAWLTKLCHYWRLCQGYELKVTSIEDVGKLSEADKVDLSTYVLTAVGNVTKVLNRAERQGYANDGIKIFVTLYEEYNVVTKPKEVAIVEAICKVYWPDSGTHLSRVEQVITALEKQQVELIRIGKDADKYDNIIRIQLERVLPAQLYGITINANKDNSYETLCSALRELSATFDRGAKNDAVDVWVH